MSNSSVTYKGVTYPTKSLCLHSKETGVRDYMIGSETLQKALLNEEFEPKDAEAAAVDQSIYYYITNDQFNVLPDEQIAAECLDIPFTLIQ